MYFSQELSSKHKKSSQAAVMSVLSIAVMLAISSLCKSQNLCGSHHPGSNLMEEQRFI